MSLLLQVFRKVVHGQKEANNFLNVVVDVVSFLPHLHHQVADIGIGASKPRMLTVELVSQNQAEGNGHKKRSFNL